MAVTDNDKLSFLPDPGEGRYWDVRYSQKYLSKPLKLSLVQSFRPGTPVGETIGYDFAEANEKHLTDTANNIMSRTADRKQFEGVQGLSSQRT